MEPFSVATRRVRLERGHSNFESYRIHMLLDAGHLPGRSHHVDKEPGIPGAPSRREGW